MEAAIAVGTLVAVLVVVLAAMGAVVVQLRCLDAAGEAARLASRGDADGARRAAVELLPGGAEVVIDVRTDDVRVRVRAAPLGGALPGVRVGAEAVAAREPDQVAPTLGSGSGSGSGSAAAGADGTDGTDGTDAVPDTDAGGPGAPGPGATGADGPGAVPDTEPGAGGSRDPGAAAAPDPPSPPGSGTGGVPARGDPTTGAATGPAAVGGTQ